MAHIRVLDQDDPKNKRYQCTYEIKTKDGTRKRRSKTFPHGTPRKEVEAFRRKVEQQYESCAPLTLNKLTVEGFAQEYFELYSDSLSPSTVHGYKQMMYAKKHGVITCLGAIELNKLSVATLQRHVKYLKDEGLSPKTIKNQINFLHAFLDKAMKLGYMECEVNPVSRLELPRQIKKKVQSYSEDEVKKLLSIVDNEGSEQFRLEVYIAIFTGARRSEIAAINLKDIDLVKKEWHINKARVTAESNQDVIKTTKTAAGDRVVPLPEILTLELKKAITRYKFKRMSAGRAFNDEGYLFSDRLGNPIRTNVLTSRWVKFWKKHQGELRYLPLHTAGRHTYASLSVSRGTDVKALQEILGHSDVTTTLGIYANSFDEKKRENAEGFDRMMSDKRKEA